MVAMIPQPVGLCVRFSDDDTLVYGQARAYFDGNMAALREARQKAVASAANNANRPANAV